MEDQKCVGNYIGLNLVKHELGKPRRNLEYDIKLYLTTSGRTL